MSELATRSIDNADRARLAWAAETLVSQRSLVMRIAEVVGGGLDRLGGRIFGGRMVGNMLASGGAKARFDALVEDAMWRGYRVAIAGLAPESDRGPRAWLAKAMVSLSGAASGFVGLPGLAVDLPVTTTLILRSIAETARAQGEDLSSDDTRRACLQVFAFGGGRPEEDAEQGYWGARVALGLLPTEQLVGQAARFFGRALSQKLMAQAIPGIGALAGGSLNYLFMDYYQAMARVHFTVRAIERRSGDPAAVRRLFDELVQTAREKRRLAGS